MFIDTFMFVRYKNFFGNLSCKRTIQYGTLFFDSKDLKKKDTGKEDDVWTLHGLHKHHKLGFYSKHLLYMAIVFG